MTQQTTDQKGEWQKGYDQGYFEGVLLLGRKKKAEEVKKRMVEQAIREFVEKMEENLVANLKIAKERLKDAQLKGHSYAATVNGVRIETISEIISDIQHLADEYLELENHDDE